MNFKNGTEASLTGRIQAVPYPGAPRDYGNVLGTIRHQVSPRILLEANLLRSPGMNLRAMYNGGENHVTLKTSVSPRSLHLPPLTLELQRQLFLNSLTQGHLIFATGSQPSFTASLVSPLHPKGALAWGAGFQFSHFPHLSAELATRPLSGGFKAKLGVELGITGLSGTVYGIWTGPESSLVSIGVGAASAGAVYTNVTLEHLGQRIHVPIVLSHEVDVIIGLCALLVPSTLAALVHNFVIKPRLRARRIAQLQAARHAYRITIQQWREEAEHTNSILSEPVHRRAEHERAIGGLVILIARYTASGEDGESPISIDVTVPLQAQVHNSQLVIPGGRSKATLLGFYDPSPGARKHLKIDYLFHGALHTTDVGDFSQVVLPLRAHLAE
ncbi:hypothetical protein JB92DRAFT_3018242 [Gautieria morchelliformis]|nr:hypothetical protein JB92DRAFT_3018242 [Gautieria morchelliformis]